MYISISSACDSFSDALLHLTHVQNYQLNTYIHALFEKAIPYHNLDNNIIAAAEQACLLPSMECGSTDDMRRLAAHWPDLRHRRPPARPLARSLLQPIGARRDTAAGPPGGSQATPRRSERQEGSVKEGRKEGERTHLVDTHAAFSRRFPP